MSPRTVTVASVTFTDAELTLPDRCPGCDANLTMPDALDETALDVVTYRGVTLVEEGFEYAQPGEIGECSTPTDYACAACGWEFLPDELRGEEDSHATP